MPYELREHTADVAVAATGERLGDAFAAVADGLAAAMADEWGPDGDRVELTVTAESRAALLFDYLDRLIFERDVRNVLPVEHRATVLAPDGAGQVEGPGGGDGSGEGEWTVEASFRGVPLETLSAREIKAVTYSEMAIDETDDGWSCYVVFDV